MQTKLQTSISFTSSTWTSSIKSSIVRPETAWQIIAGVFSNSNIECSPPHLKLNSALVANSKPQILQGDGGGGGGS